MSGLDMKMLRDRSKDLAKKAGGVSNIKRCKDLGEEQDLRILEPSDKMNGAYYATQEGWWIKGKFYQTNDTFGGEDVINEEVVQAREEGDEDVIALLDALKDKMRVVKKEERSIMPVLWLKCKYNEDEELVSTEVEDDEGKIFEINKATLMNAMHAIVTNKQYQNQTKEGITHRKKGWNMIIGKKGKGLDTEYYAMGWTAASEFDDKYYSGDKYPDVVKFIENQRKSDDYLRSVIRNYLYGEALIEDTSKKEKDAPKAAPKAETDTKPTGASTEAAPKKSARPNTKNIGADTVADSGRPKSARPNTGTKKDDAGGSKATGRSSRGKSLLDDAVDELGADTDDLKGLD